MHHSSNRNANYFRVTPQIYLWLTISIFGAANSITRKLTEIGARHLQSDRNPISLCNVLFVGNLCALLVLLIIHWRQVQPAMLKRLSQRECLGLIVVATKAKSDRAEFLEHHQLLTFDP